MEDKAFLEFISKIETVREELRCSKTGAFYRGHTHKTHSLIPSLLRTDFSPTIEHNLYVESFARSRHLMKDYRNSWELLSIMQHFGIPTRLLDWSESLSTALFFALTDENSDSDPQIWITNGFALNGANKDSKKLRILTIGIDNAPDYEKCFISLDNTTLWPYKRPIFLQIPWSNERISNQKGFFTVHPNSEPMELNCKNYVKCVMIKKEAIPGVKRFLEYSGVNEYTIFPDLEGFGRFLKKRYKV